MPVLSTLLLLVSCGQAEQGVPTQPPSMFLVIHNSGSTNFPGFTITVNTDGSGTLIYEKCRSALTRPQCQKPNKTFPLRTFQINTIRQLLTQIGTIQNIPNHTCTKSASFGSVTKIKYNGQESGDISCTNSTDPRTYQQLKKEVDMLISQATYSGQREQAHQAFARAMAIVQQLAAKMEDEARRSNFLAEAAVRHVLELG